MGSRKEESEKSEVEEDREYEEEDFEPESMLEKKEEGSSEGAGAQYSDDFDDF